jgi:hypothetical protein
MAPAKSVACRAVVRKSAKPTMTATTVAAKAPSRNSSER